MVRWILAGAGAGTIALWIMSAHLPFVVVAGNGTSLGFSYRIKSGTWNISARWETPMFDTFAPVLDMTFDRRFIGHEPAWFAPPVDFSYGQRTRGKRYIWIQIGAWIPPLVVLIVAGYVRLRPVLGFTDRPPGSRREGTG